MQLNPEIETILTIATRLAHTHKHKYVTVEHLCLALLRHPPFWSCVDKYGVSPEGLDEDLEFYLDTLVALKIGDGKKTEPKKTNALERVFNRALTQVMFGGRRTMATIDLWLSIMGETNSHAHYFMLKHGMDKAEFVTFWQEHYRQKGETGMQPTQANTILKEHCINITELANNDKLEPVIGRETELDEIITVLAKKFKSNVLMVGDPGVGKTAIAE